MEVHHKLKPIKNWREFLKEYGIIVLGVLTALGAEQAVEAIHRHAEVQEAREALGKEMAHNLWTLQLTLDQRRRPADRNRAMESIAARRASAPA